MAPPLLKQLLAEFRSIKGFDERMKALDRAIEEPAPVLVAYLTLVLYDHLQPDAYPHRPNFWADEPVLADAVASWDAEHASPKRTRRAP